MGARGATTPRRYGSRTPAPPPKRYRDFSRCWRAAKHAASLRRPRRIDDGSAAMMRLPAFTYLAPPTVAEAARAVVEHGGEAMLVAGGTDLYPNMKRRQFEPKVLIGLGAIRELRGVSGRAREGLRIGPTTTLTAGARHPEIARHYGALATAAGLVSSPQLRNMGTIGGNVCVDTRCNYYNQSYEWRKAVGFCTKKDGVICLVAPRSPRCWAVSSSDTAPVLWSLGARLRLHSAAGERTIPVEALFRDDGIEYLAKRPDEILTEILLPPADGWRSAYLKLRRRGSFDFPVLGVAVAVRMEGDVVRDARIVVGAVASQPRPAPAAAAAPVRGAATPGLSPPRPRLAPGPAEPLRKTDFTPPYRQQMTRGLV